MEEQVKNQMLDLLLGSLTQEAKKFAETEIDEIKKKVNDDLTKMKSDAETLRTELNKVLEDCPTVVNLGTVEKPQKELTHKAFDTITKILSSAKRKEKNIMLVGGAGGGKTHLVKQIAESLKLPFYPMSVGLQTTKSDLLGFINATGGYVPSCVREAYENGGVLLLDEFDSAHAGVVTILNSLLANGHCSFPDKIVSKNEKFVCLVACNTYGTSGNLDYIGRNRLDGATLDRFIIVDVDYDSKLEKKLTNNDAWYELVNKIRKNAEKNGIKTIISPRACMDGADLLEAGFTTKEAIQMTIFKGCSEDLRKKLIQGVEEDTTPKKQKNGIDIEVSLFEEDDRCCIVKRGEYNTKLVIHSNELDGHKISFAPWYEDSGIYSRSSNNEVVFNSVKDTKLDRSQKTFNDVVEVLKTLRFMDNECNFVGKIKFNLMFKNEGLKVMEFDSTSMDYNEDL